MQCFVVIKSILTHRSLTQYTSGPNDRLDGSKYVSKDKVDSTKNARIGRLLEFRKKLRETKNADDSYA